MRKFGNIISVQYLFIIFERHMTHDTLLKCMKEFKIPTKLINMCRTRLQNTRSDVRIEGTLSSCFENKTGLKQGNSLSPTQFTFTLALQKVTQSIKMVPRLVNNN
jgi:hypothetical protein